MNSHPSSFLHRNLAFACVALATAALLLVPLVAMQLTGEVDWSFSDFLIMGVLLFGSGCSFVLLARRVRPKRRLVVPASLAVLFLYLWAELAVGVFTNLGS